MPRQPAGTPGRRRGCRGHRTDDRGSSVAHWCSLVWIPSTRASASSTVGHGAPVFTGDLLAFQSHRCGLAAPLRHVAGFPGLGLLRGLRPTPEAISRRRACPPPAWLAGGEGEPGSGSHVHHRPVDGGGAQLFPCSLATGTPQAFPVASATGGIYAGVGVAHPAHGRACTAARPISTRLEPVSPLEGVPPLVHCIVTPFRLACRARAVWQCRPVPSLSGLLPPSPAPPGSGCPQLQRPAATGRRRVLSSRPVTWRLVAHEFVEKLLTSAMVALLDGADASSLAPSSSSEAKVGD